MEQRKCCETLSGLGSVALTPLAFATVFLNGFKLSGPQLGQKLIIYISAAVRG